MNEQEQKVCAYMLLELEHEIQLGGTKIKLMTNKAGESLMVIESESGDMMVAHIEEVE